MGPKNARNQYFSTLEPVGIEFQSRPSETHVNYKFFILNVWLGLDMYRTYLRQRNILTCCAYRSSKIIPATPKCYLNG